SYWTAQRLLGVTMLGAGVVAAGVGAAFAVAGKAQYDSARGGTGAARHDDSVSAVRKANAGTGLLSAGGAVAAAGIVLWLTAPVGGAKVGTNGQQLWVERSF